MSSVGNELANIWAQDYPPANNVTAQLYGDSHCIGFNNQNFDCHPQHDAVLFKNASGDFEIHSRHKPVNVNSANGPTWIIAIAVKEKSHTIQYNATDDKVLIDGQIPQFRNDAYFLSDTETFVVLENAQRFHIYTNSGARVTVCNAGGHNLNVALTLPRSLAQNAAPSMLGNIAGGHAQTILAAGLFH